MPQGISLNRNLDQLKSLLTPRQRRVSRQLWPELAAKPAGPHASTRTLRRQTVPPLPWFGRKRRKVQLMRPDRARQLLRYRRRTERQNRRRGRHQARR